MSKSHKTWWNVKAQLIARFGSLVRAARALDCSTEAIRQAVHGRCPGVRAKLDALLAETGSSVPAAA